MRPPSFVAIALLSGLIAAPATAQSPAGRLADATGTISSRTPGTAWSVLPRGAGLVEGQALRTGPRARAELDLGPNRLGLDPDTVLRIDSAHPAMPAFTLEQGRATFLLRSLRPGQVARLDLARASVTFAEPGLYVVSAPEGGRPATVGVSRGLAQVYGQGVSLAVSAGQTGFFAGIEPAALRQGVADGFLADDPTPPPPQIVRPDLPPPPAAAVPDLADVPGADPLRAEGQWVDVPDHGAVWYPPVAPAWNPYADPWAADRWGYAPWNYGAWIMIGPRWAWMPPRRVPPPAWRHAHPPPGVAQPQRPLPPFARPLPHPHSQQPIPTPTVPVPHPASYPRAPGPATPIIVAPRQTPPSPPPTMVPPIVAPGAPAMAPPPMAAPLASPSSAAPPPLARPQPALPHMAPQPAPPSLVAPRPAPPPIAVAPPMLAPRPAPPPPMAAPPPRSAFTPPARACPPGRPVC